MINAVGRMSRKTIPHGRTCSGRSIEIAPLATRFVLTEILGKRNVKNYDGSWTEYGSLVGVTVDVGNGRASGDVRLGINDRDIVPGLSVAPRSQRVHRRRPVDRGSERWHGTSAAGSRTWSLGTTAIPLHRDRRTAVTTTRGPC